jgi:hypothetical protein
MESMTLDYLRSAVIWSDQYLSALDKIDATHVARRERHRAKHRYLIVDAEADRATAPESFKRAEAIVDQQIARMSSTEKLALELLTDLIRVGETTASLEQLCRSIYNVSLNLAALREDRDLEIVIQAGTLRCIR